LYDLILETFAGSVKRDSMTFGSREVAMARKRIGQLGWGDRAVLARRKQREDRLAKIGSLIDWQPFERLLGDIHPSRRGEPSYPPLMMFKVLLLQRWYQLSDPQMEEALYDRLSFQRFAGLALADDTPDHSTIFRFRDQLTRRGLMGPLLAELARQLDISGAVLKQGTLIDATIVQSAARRPRMDEAKVSPVDPDARFGTNNERRLYTFGYKVHAAVDHGSGLVRAVLTTPANIQEVAVARELVQGDEQAVYADRGYDACWLHDVLAAHGIADGIMRRNRTNRRLTPAEVTRNHTLSLRRRTVEKLFGTLKRSYRLSRMPYFSLARNATAVALACFAFNLRRWQVMATG
jgi:IS5 family transposase